MAKIYGSPGDEYGDQRVFNLLEKLPWRFYIYAQPIVQGGCDLCFPDYVIVDPRQGLIVLEVKDWTTVLEAKRYKALIQRGENGDTVWEKRPIEQARNASYILRNSLEKDPQLIQHRGQYQGKLKFPIEYAGFLPHQPDVVVRRLEKTWGRKRIFGKRELENPNRFTALINQFPYHFSLRQGLSKKDIKYIHSYLFPHIIIQEKTGSCRKFSPPCTKSQPFPVGAA